MKPQPRRVRIRNAWRNLGMTISSPVGYMSDDDLQLLADKVPLKITVKAIEAESLKLLQASRTDEKRKDL